MKTGEGVAGVAAYAASQSVRDKNLSGVQQISCWTKIPSGNSGRRGPGLKVRVVIEAQIGHGIGDAQIGVVTVQGFPDVSVQAPPARVVRVSRSVVARAFREAGG